MKLRDFKREAIILIKNHGVHNAGKILGGIGVGALSYVALSQVIPSWKSQTKFDEKYKKVCAIVGLTAATSGFLMEDLSEHKHCLTAGKGTLSEDYLEVFDSLSKD